MGRSPSVGAEVEAVEAEVPQYRQAAVEEEAWAYPWVEVEACR